jgi:hypothetical protein
MEARRLIDARTGVIEDLRDAKVLDLAKKNRVLQLAIGREKDKADRLEKKLGAMGLGLTEAPPAALPAAAAGSGPRAARAMNSLNVKAHAFASPKEVETKAAHTFDAESSRVQVRSLTSQLQKTMRQVELLRLEVSACHKALQKEVGPDIPLARILSANGVPRTGASGADGLSEDGGETRETARFEASTLSAQNSVSGGTTFTPGDWRGRAQSIAVLRSRVRALERELEGRGNGGSGDFQLLQQSHVSHTNSATSNVLVPYGGSNSAVNNAIDSSFAGLGDFSGSVSFDPRTGGPPDAAFGLGLDDSVLVRRSGGPPPPPQPLIPFAPRSSVAGNAAPIGALVDDRVAANLAGKAEAKSAKVSALQAELATTLAALERSKQEASAKTARANVLENDIKKAKGAARSLLEKSAADDRLVDKLRQELALLTKDKASLSSSLETAERHAKGDTDSARALAEAQSLLQQQRITINSLKEHIAILRGGNAERGIIPSMMA